MALTPTVPINLSDIQTETSTSSLDAAGAVANFQAGGTYMTEFLGWMAPRPIVWPPYDSVASTAVYRENATSISGNSYLNLNIVSSQYINLFFNKSTLDSSIQLNAFMWIDTHDLGITLASHPTVKMYFDARTISTNGGTLTQQYILYGSDTSGVQGTYMTGGNVPTAAGTETVSIPSSHQNYRYLTIRFSYSFGFGLTYWCSYEQAFTKLEFV